MNFVSLEFFALFASVLGLYAFLGRRGQNLLLLIASYVFYGWWDWRFLGLLAVSTLLDYGIGRAMAACSVDELKRRRRKILVALSVTVNLGVLGVFKYYDFFVSSFAAAFSSIGINWTPELIHVVLPVGISFYTFQTMSYSIDLYRGRCKPSKSLLDFAVYVAFFPQLVAGPIERSWHMLPQLEVKRRFHLPWVSSGLALILIGLFKKTVIADNVALFTDAMFASPEMTIGQMMVGSFAFAIQIYCDFSAYTDIARGTGRTLGIDLMENFRRPYFAATPSEFWQRWHISLSSWLRDYLYIPLGGNRKGRFGTYRNLMLTMLLGGLWHGAHIKFIAWGVFHGGLLCAYRVLGIDERLRKSQRWRIPMVVVFFAFTCIGWFLFRVNGGTQLVNSFHAITRFDLGLHAVWPIALLLVVIATPLFAFQLLQERKNMKEVWLEWPIAIQSAFYLALLVLMLLVGAPKVNEFIYFQF